MKAKTLVWVTAFLLVQSALWWWWWRQNPMISNEHGPMENLQVLALLGGMAGFLWAARGTDAAHRVFFTSLALFCFSFAIWEFDTRPFGWDGFNPLYHDVLRDAWIVAMWLVAAFFFWPRARAVCARFWQWLRRPAGWFFLAAAPLWVASGITDKLDLFEGTNHFVEELFEVNACLLMLSSAALTLRTRAGGETGIPPDRDEAR